MHEFGIGRAANVAIASLPGFTIPGDVSGSDKYYAQDIVEPPILAYNGAIRFRRARPGRRADRGTDRSPDAPRARRSRYKEETHGSHKIRAIFATNGSMIRRSQSWSSSSRPAATGRPRPVGGFLAGRFGCVGCGRDHPNTTGGDHLVGRFAGTADRAPALVLAHFDTVWPWDAGTHAVPRRPGRSGFGPGAFDMKASLVIFLGSWSCSRGAVSHCRGPSGRSLPRTRSSAAPLRAG